MIQLNVESQQMPTREFIQKEIQRLKGAGQDDIRHKYLASA